MRKFILVVTFLIIYITISNSPLHATKDERIIIGFNEQIELSVLDDTPYQLHHRLDKINAIAVTVPAEFVEDLHKYEEIAWIEQDQIVKTSQQKIEWGHQVTIPLHARKLDINGNGVKVGIIDTGISTQHPDLQISNGISFIEGNPSYNDDNGHGTHVAGIIAAENNNIGVLGVAPGVELYAIKALDKTGEGRQTDIIAGLEWAAEQDLDIVNLSITSHQPSIALEKATNKANQEGIILVAASGNIDKGAGQVGADIMYPARYPAVISVGSVDQNLIRSNFSYIGGSLDFVAPGEKIVSTYINEQGTGYLEQSGTSMAAPYVTGIVALYKQVYPNLDWKILQPILTTNVIDLGDKGKDAIYGYGLIQAPTVWFWDLKADVWYSDAITILAENNYISGYQDGTFRPNTWITRGEVVEMIGRVLDLDNSQNESSFKDVADTYFASGYIAAMSKSGLTSGYPDNTFKAEIPITRGEVAVIISKAFHIVESSNKSIFSDVDQHIYYADSINRLYQAEVITGYPNGNYLPGNNLTRAEFCIILSKLIEGS